mgnify:CR=1 FL=1
MNIGSLFSRHARYRPNHLAVVFEDQRLTWLEFNQSINRLANGLLGMGIQKGDKVATLLPNCLELLEVYWAVAKIGAVVVPLSTLLLEKAMQSLLQDSDSVLLITNSSFADQINAIKSEISAIAEDRYLLTDSSDISGFQDYHALKAAASDREPEGIAIDPDDPFNIMYSSGTTGLPKGIIHTHRIRAAYATSFAAAYRMTPESVNLHAGAIVFNGAFVDLMPTVFVGATYILLNQFEPNSYIETIEQEKVTHIMVVPAQIIAMLNSPNFSYDSLKSLEMILSLGAPLHREHKEELNKKLPGRFYELYGLTEGFVTVLDKNDYAAKPDSVGVPPPFFEMKIADQNGKEVPTGEVGEICGRGPILMPEYYKRPDLTAEAIKDGWLHSGDMGYVDEDGFLYLVDRKKDMIVTGGENVYSTEVENVLYMHPAILEAAVFSVPDERWGEVGHAFVIPRKGSNLRAEDLIGFCSERMAKFKCPKKVSFCEEFPRTSLGKIRKQELVKNKELP